MDIQECLKVICTKHKVYSKFLNIRNLHDLKKSLRHIATDWLKLLGNKKKKNYLHIVFNEETMSKADQIWQMINQLLNRSSANNNIEEIKIGSTTFRGK